MASTLVQHVCEGIDSFVPVSQSHVISEDVLGLAKIAFICAFLGISVLRTIRALLRPRSEPRSFIPQFASIFKALIPQSLPSPSTKVFDALDNVRGPRITSIQKMRQQMSHTLYQSISCRIGRRKHMTCKNFVGRHWSSRPLLTIIIVDDKKGVLQRESISRPIVIKTKNVRREIFEGNECDRTFDTVVSRVLERKTHWWQYQLILSGGNSLRCGFVQSR